MFEFFSSKKREIKRRRKAVLQSVEAQMALKESYKRLKESKPKTGQKFGGYTVDFKGQDATLEDLFGSKPVTTPEMTKKLWQHIKKNKLGGR